MRLNLIDYRESVEISRSDPSFAALIAAAMRKADSQNMALLTAAFPEIAEDVKRRYNAPGGELPGDRVPRLDP